MYFLYRLISKNRPYLAVLLIFCSVLYTSAQKSVLVFYNVENLFDPEDDPKTYDEAYTPKGNNHWDAEALHQKLDQLATVLSKIHFKDTHAFPTLIGLAEVENYNVVQRLAQHPKLQEGLYEVIHADSRDGRGIDVALLYNREHFSPLETQQYPLALRNPETNTKYYSRDVLVVQGILFGEEVFITVNHWPSRRGGRQKSNPLRLSAAQQQLQILDSIYRLQPQAKIVVMGDFNDNPIDESLQALQLPQTYLENFVPLHNSMEQLFVQGAGSLAHNDRWFLFDQLLWSPFWGSSKKGLHVETTAIFHPKWLYTPKGRYKGYPYRTARTGPYLNGYSDHFPVYAILRELKEINFPMLWGLLIFGFDALG